MFHFFRVTARRSRSKSSLILFRVNERLHHVGLNKIAVELIQFVQPEIVTVKISLRRVVGISLEITEVLHQHKRAIEFMLGQRLVLSYVSERPRPRPHVDGRDC